MKARSAARLAWFLGALTLVMFLAYVALALSRPARLPPAVTPFEPERLLGDVPFLVFAGTGVLIAARRPQNPIGWMFIAVGFLFLFPVFATDYALYALHTNPGSLPAGAFAAWATTWSWLVGVGVLVLVVLLFPNGRLSTRRWRPLAWIVVADIVISVLAVAVLLWPERGLQLVGVWEQASTTRTDSAIRIISFGFPLLIVSMLGAIVSILLRFRRSRGEERQQLKWVVYGGSLPLAINVATQLVTGFRETSFLLLVEAIGVLALPVSTGIAVLKYRLYDIDLIINRTLVYLVLTATLGLSYFALVAGISSVAGESSLTVAGATLAVAALFQPLRQRIQAFIDRRFYRSKYDAEQTLADFSAKLRNDIDLDHLTTEMAAVVHDTLQPAHFSLWLRTP
ncbi:MAG TPA: hypothetical protein VFF07_14005 [Actinomycetota bacterium]|nr:hypothetical protein [Actinomycetota bacterium]